MSETVRPHVVVDHIAGVQVDRDVAIGGVIHHRPIDVIHGVDGLTGLDQEIQVPVDDPLLDDVAERLKHDQG